MDTIKNVGVIGLGKMGMPVARLLRERGFTVTGYDTALPALKAASGKGIQPVNSPKAVAAASDLTIVAVGFDSEVEAVMLGDTGALAGASDGSVIAIASTVAPATMRKLKRRCAHRPAVARARSMPAGRRSRRSPMRSFTSARSAPARSARWSTI